MRLRLLNDRDFFRPGQIFELEDSFACLVPQGAEVAARFYERLFERYPSVKPLFAHTAMRR